jgi:hypothetical protein
MTIALGILAGICGALHFVQFRSEVPATIAATPFRLKDAGRYLRAVTLWVFVGYFISGYKPELRQEMTEGAFWLVCIANLLYSRAFARLFELHLLVVRHYDLKLFEETKE